MLELQDLCFQVSDDADKQKEIIRDVNLTFQDHAFIAITGPNGGGKSTLAKLIMGIEQPTSGRIVYNGTDITKMNITERAKLGISFAFQQPVRFKGIKVRDLIRLAAGTDIPFSSICDYLSRVGLCARDYVNRDVDASLSGGELKRIEIAMVLARGTKLSIFDEPEAALSPQRQLTLLAEIYHSAGRGSQFLIATHSPILLALPGSAIFTFDDGPIHPCAYEETGSYQITKMFVNNRDRLLRELLAEEESPVTAPAADAGAFHPA